MTGDDFIDPPQVWYVWDGERLFLPYPGGRGTGTERAARAHSDINAGWQAVQMEVTFAEEGHQCVMEHTHSEPNFGEHYECKICGAKSP